VVAEQLVSLELASDKRRIVQQSFSFKDPQRWHGGLERPDIFKSITPTTADGDRLRGLLAARGDGLWPGTRRPDSAGCARGATGLSMQVDIVTKISPAEYGTASAAFSKRAAGVQ